MQNLTSELSLALNRRAFLRRNTAGIGLAALTSLLQESQASEKPAAPTSGLHFPAKAKRVIYLSQSGAPSQLDLFDYKPGLKKFHKTELPDSIRRGQRLTGMTSGQKSFPIAASMYQFARYGESGTWMSELLPHTAKMADELCIVKSLYTEAINHDPAITFLQTGSIQAGRPSMGSWISYGLGSENRDLPTFVALTSGAGGQPLYDRLWGSGFLPTRHQGVKFRRSSDPVLFLSNPPGIDQQARREMLDDLGELNRISLQQKGDPEIATRISQYELAFRMQSSVPELTDLSEETPATFDLYGEQAKQPGTYAANCLLARRLAERGVRFIQLYHRGWDHHLNLPTKIRQLTGETDQATAALILDLKQRGMLDDTLVVWAGEFGRTVYCQGTLTATNYGRDHHPRCFTVWAAGGGMKPGLTFGQTDDFSYNITENPLPVHDLNATILHCLGVDHKKLTYKFQGRDYRLTDVHGNVVQQLLS
ncbi:MAG TPA: sulfatase [Planctomycetaceae bacterium]|nr:sulfatase [Planctomycetaceae bacterium]|tara:strand:- start:2087 stop:3523 length:1437 start_codon:yes stop_codon:yes gene_type:complete